MLRFVTRPAARHVRRLASIVVIIGTAIMPAVAIATDFNADYDVVVPCVVSFGGVSLTVQPMSGLPAASITDKWISVNYADLTAIYAFAWGPCGGGANTLVSWALNGSTSPCIATSDILHVGVSTNQQNNTVISAYLYNNQATCPFTTNLPTTSCSPTVPACALPAPPPAPARLLVDPIPYHPLSSTAWYVHADGKSLTVINGETSPPRPCPKAVYVGNVRFLYYATRQPLSTLNRDSLRAPIAMIALEEDELVACNDSVTISNFSNPPDDAEYVVVSATQDTVPTLDSPGVSHIWIQDAIVREGEHVIIVTAGTNGTIDPSGPVVVANGGSQAFTITPVAGYRVADVLVDGVSVGPVTTYTFTNVTANHRIEATFAPINSAPDCSLARAVPDQIWPPNHQLVSVKLAGITDADGDPVSAKIVRVTQDEPSTNGPHHPDAMVDDTAACQVRAERAGNGNGRVYTLWYTASDGRGGECAGSVQVCVPHDRHHLDCIDDGPVDEGIRPGTPGGLEGESPRAGRLELTRTSISGHQATVEYSIPSAGTVQLSLFDVAGRHVATIEDSPQEEGTHEVTWNAAGLARGMYFYRLRSGSGVVVKPLVIR